MKKILLITAKIFVHSGGASLQRSKVIHQRSQLHRLDCKYLFTRFRQMVILPKYRITPQKSAFAKSPKIYQKSVDTCANGNAKWGAVPCQPGH